MKSKEERAVNWWNLTHHVGQSVRVVDDVGEQHDDVIRSDAYLVGNTPVVRLEKRGAYALERVEATGV